jgi:hypothetical protein
MREFVVLMQMIGLGLVLLASGGAAQPHPQARASAEGILFSESFEDADLASRGWYDGASFRIVGEAMAGKGCIEYEWPDRQSDVKGSSPVRHLFDFRLNTLDLRNDRPNRDGIVRGWCDGKLVVEHTDVVLRSTDFPTMKFNQFLMAPYFGPGLLPHAQKLWIDELAVGTKRIGPLALPKNERKRTKK